MKWNSFLVAQPYFDDSYVLVWDTSCNRPRLVRARKNGQFEEESGKLRQQIYHPYSHFMLFESRP